MSISFITLDIEFDKGCIFCSISSYPNFRLGDVDVIDEIESWNTVKVLITRWVRDNKSILISSTSSR